MLNANSEIVTQQASEVLELTDADLNDWAVLSWLQLLFSTIYLRSITAKLTAVLGTEILPIVWGLTC